MINVDVDATDRSHETSDHEMSDRIPHSLGHSTCSVSTVTQSCSPGELTREVVSRVDSPLGQGSGLMFSLFLDSIG